LDRDSARAPQFVFGYGSLISHRPDAGRLPGEDPEISRCLTREPHATGFIADLVGFRRVWGVAMDNRRDLPGYKYYTTADGRRPGVFVAFLDLRPADAREAVVNGVCLPVDEAALVALDRRERNYERVEVSDLISGSGADRGLRIWTYVGSAAGRERLRQGRADGIAVVDANYVAAVNAGFAALGEAEHRTCTASLDPGDLPVVPLRRHDLA
jgi:cation transport regulator ChaC